MPVTLKLSKKFYETFGEQVTNELVDAFNHVDATYRSDLREMNESNRAHRFMLLGWSTMMTAIVAAVITAIFALR